MSSRKDETRVCGYICSEFIHWAFCRTLMRKEYFLFVYHTTSILAKLSTRCFEQSGDISCSLIVDPSHTDEFWEGWNTCLWIYIYIYIYIHIYIYIYIHVDFTLKQLFPSGDQVFFECNFSFLHQSPTEWLNSWSENMFVTVLWCSDFYSNILLLLEGSNHK